MRPCGICCGEGWLKYEPVNPGGNWVTERCWKCTEPDVTDEIIPIDDLIDEAMSRHSVFLADQEALMERQRIREGAND